MVFGSAVTNKMTFFTPDLHSLHNLNCGKANRMYRKHKQLPRPCRKCSAGRAGVSGGAPPPRPLNVGQNMGRRARGRALTPPCIPRVPCRCGPLYYTYDSAAAPATLIPLHAHLSSPCRLCTPDPYLSLSTLSFELIIHL